MADYGALNDANSLLAKADALLGAINAEMGALQGAIETGEQSLRHADLTGKNMATHVADLGLGLRQGQDLMRGMTQTIAKFESIERNVSRHADACMALPGLLVGSTVSLLPPRKKVAMKREARRQAFPVPDTKRWDLLAQHEVLWQDRLPRLLSENEDTPLAGQSETQTVAPATIRSVPEHDS